MSSISKCDKIRTERDHLVFVPFAFGFSDPCKPEAVELFRIFVIILVGVKSYDQITSHKDLPRHGALGKQVFPAGMNVPLLKVKSLGIFRNMFTEFPPKKKIQQVGEIVIEMNIPPGVP
jgi:hypothetical protein